MPRGPRSDAPNEIHHVWTRGLERRAIFLDRADRLDLLDRFSLVLPESGVLCLAWSLLPNHFHLVLKRGHVPLSRVMARINSGYATAFNRRHERAGFLFQNRFGSRIVDGDAELISVVRYVVRNPLRHSACGDEEDLARYPWGSLSGIEGARPPFPFERLPDTRNILHGTEGRGLAERAAQTSLEIPTTSSADALEELIARVCRRLCVEPAALESQRRPRDIADARAAVCWLAVTRLGLPGAQVGGRLRMSRSAVSHALRRGRLICRDLDEVIQLFNERPRR